MSGASDPFYVAKDEVAGALAHVDVLFEEWQQKGQRDADAEKLLNGPLREVEQDVTDLSSAIDIAARDPARYRCDADELQRRRQFVQATQASLRKTRDTLERARDEQRARKQAEREEAERSKRQRAEARNQRFIDDQRTEQQQVFAQQDNELDELTKCTERLGEQALVINNELVDQARLLQELDEDVDRQAEKLNFVMKHMAKVLKTSDTKQLYLICVLIIILIILIFVAFG